MTNITNSRVIIDVVMWFCWWPLEKPWAYQAARHDDLPYEDWKTELEIWQAFTNIDINPWEKNGHRDCSPWAHRELTVTKMVPASRDWAVTWAVIELWPSRDWAVIILKMPWLSCDLAVTELWPRRDWAVTSPSCDWAVIIRPGAVTTVVTVSSRWQFFSHGKCQGSVLCFTMFGKA